MTRVYPYLRFQVSCKCYLLLWNILVDRAGLWFRWTVLKGDKSVIRLFALRRKIGREHGVIHDAHSPGIQGLYAVLPLGQIDEAHQCLHGVQKWCVDGNNAANVFAARLSLVAFVALKSAPLICITLHTRKISYVQGKRQLPSTFQFHTNDDALQWSSFSFLFFWPFDRILL